MTRAEFANAMHKQFIEDSDADIGVRFETYDALFHTGTKMIEYFSSHDRILISVSGGSDSDCIVHLICTYFPEYLDKCYFVFVNTGLEYAATKRHLCDLEAKYGIKIERIRGTSVVTAVRKYGVPILNKCKAKPLSMFLRGTPKGSYFVFERNDGVFAFTENERLLALYCQEKGIKVSANCCNVSKKKPIHDYIKLHNIDLDVSGERKAEGGRELQK